MARTTARRVGRYGILRKIGRGYLEALGAAIFASYLAGRGHRRRRAGGSGGPAGAGPPRPVDVLLDGLAARFSEG